MEFAIAIPQTYPDRVRIQRFLKRAEQLPLALFVCFQSDRDLIRCPDKDKLYPVSRDGQ
jgi:hypothetical protein